MHPSLFYDLFCYLFRFWLGGAVSTAYEEDDFCHLFY